MSCVSISFDIGIPMGWCGIVAATTTTPPWHAAGGAGSRGTPGARNVTVPLFRYECQSFLDKVIAGLGQIGHGMIRVRRATEHTALLCRGFSSTLRGPPVGRCP